MSFLTTATSTRSSPKDLDLELESGPSKKICQAPDYDSSAIVAVIMKLNLICQAKNIYWRASP